MYTYVYIQIHTKCVHVVVIVCIRITERPLANSFQLQHSSTFVNNFKVHFEKIK